MATILCQYRYDALDRLVTCVPTEQTTVQRFYQKTRLATELQGQTQHRIFQHEDVLLAQKHCDGETSTTTLLLADQQRSILRRVSTQENQATAYTAYGHRPAEGGLTSLLGFNGERLDPITGHYLLGNGYRAFNPQLMRFNSPDSLSPFGKGGLNGYAYCVGDPVNRVDPTGHTWVFLKVLLRRLNVMRPSAQLRADAAYEALSNPSSIRSGANARSAVVQSSNIAAPLSTQRAPPSPLLEVAFGANTQGELPALTSARDGLQSSINRSPNRNPLANEHLGTRLREVNSLIDRLHRAPPPAYHSLPPAYEPPPPTYEEAMKGIRGTQKKP